MMKKIPSIILTWKKDNLLNFRFEISKENFENKSLKNIYSFKLIWDKNKTHNLNFFSSNSPEGIAKFNLQNCSQKNFEY